MKKDEIIEVLKTLLPENSLEKLSFPPGWGGGFSNNKEGITEVAEILQQHIDKRKNSGKTGTTKQQSVDWLESVWAEEEQGRNTFEKWVLECAKNSDELRSRVKQLKAERAAKQREREKREAERQRREAEEAERRRIEEEEAAARREAQRKAREKREAERLKREAEEAEKRKIEEQEAEARREERRRERARRRAEDAAEVAEQVAAITASIEERKAEKERIRLERRQKQNEGTDDAESCKKEVSRSEYAERRQRELEYAERRRNKEEETGKIGWTIVLSICIALALLCGLWVISHGFDEPLAKTGVVWPWCWWHIKFVIGLGLLLDFAILIAIFSHPWARDFVSQDSQKRYHEVVCPLLLKFASVYVLTTIGMYIYALCHLFSALGFSFRALGMGLLFTGEFFIVALSGVLFHYLFNGMLWGCYDFDY